MIAGVFGELLATGGIARQLIAAFILGVTRVSLDPEPLDLMAGNFRIQLLPEVDVLDRLAV